MRRVTFLIIGWCIVTTVLADPGDEDFRSAREAVQTGDRARLAQAADRLADYPLYPYVESWLLRPRLQEFPEEAVRDFLTRYDGQLVANRMRAEWLRVLGRARRWDDFDRYFDGLVDPDQDLRCQATQSRARREPGALAAGRALWFTSRDLPDGCKALFDEMFAKGALREADAWQRLRIALAAGNTGLAKSLTGRVPAWTRADAKRLDAAGRNPSRYLAQKHPPVRTRGEREVLLYALGRVARESVDTAAGRWKQLAAGLPRGDREYGWGVIAVAGARQHAASTLAWFGMAGDTAFDDSQLEWRARAALRVQDWKDLLATLGALSAETREQAAWRYWRARALRELGRESEAIPILATLASEHHFHAELAAEEMGPALSAAPVNYKPSEQEVERAAATPGLRRALTFYRLGLRYEGNLEWIWTVRGMDDASLLAAAELARRSGWWERAIATADRSRSLINMELRYPTPYEEFVRASAREFGVDDAWVYGIVRQESRFNPSARSSVGASGLMQIMPDTARWIARKLGLTDWRRAIEDAPDANVNFGTFYMKEMMDKLDGSPVLASAAYNAGPRRAENWRATVPLEGAIYIDTIPFSETRDYVRKVMANAVQYARRFGRQMETLSRRIGIVPARSGSR